MVVSEGGFDPHPRPEGTRRPPRVSGPLLNRHALGSIAMSIVNSKAAVIELESRRINAWFFAVAPLCRPAVSPRAAPIATLPEDR